MKKAVTRAVDILNEKIVQNRMHDGKFELKISRRPDQSMSIGLYYTDNIRHHTIALLITNYGGYEFFYDQLIPVLALLKTVTYEDVNGFTLDIYNIGELMNKGTYNYIDSFNKLKVI